MRACGLAFLLTQTRSDGGSSESEHADVTVSPLRRPGSAPTVTSATAPAHWRIACLKLSGSIAMLRAPVLNYISSTAKGRVQDAISCPAPSRLVQAALTRS